MCSSFFFYMQKLLRKKELKSLKVFFNDDFLKNKLVYVKDSNTELIFYNGVVFLFKSRSDESFIPTIHAFLSGALIKKYPSVYVDQGAIRFIVGGADVMRPGVVSYDDFNSNDIVVVKDNVNKKPLVVGLALFGSDELENINKGKVIKNIHYVGDFLWKKSLN